MAIPPIGVTHPAWSRAATGPADEPDGLQVARAAGRADSTSKAPPSPRELRNVAEVLLNLAREQGLFGAPAVDDRDILRVVKLDRALAQAKANNLSKAGPEWTGALAKLGPRIVNRQMNDSAYGLKADLVRAASRFEAAASGYRSVEPYALAHPGLLTTGVARNALEVGVLKALNEYRVAAEQLELARGRIESMILQLSPKP
jgi:hypothetical protein